MTMPAELIESPQKTLAEREGGGLPPEPGRHVDSDGDEPWLNPARFGLWAFLGTITMLFIGLTSAYMVRRVSYDWRPLVAPPLLWVNTGILVVSSFCLESARRRIRRWELREASAALTAAGALGVAFAIGQIGAWRQLRALGVFLASNPHSSFFYVLSGLHLLHLAGGLAWYAVVTSRLRRMGYVPGEDGLSLFATYWHFLSVLWVYLVLLLFVF